jgi:3-phenylpropionate/trans-cinnamate dioxygenase ferredoxin subunit
LDQGELIGGEIECPRHGARFDVATGRATRLPAIQPVRTYPVRVEGGMIKVEVE